MFSVVFLENCGFFASWFSLHCGINFLQCSEYLFSVLPELISLHLLESRGLFLCVFSHYIKEIQSVLLACKLGFTKYKAGQTSCSKNLEKENVCFLGGRKLFVTLLEVWCSLFHTHEAKKRGKFKTSVMLILQKEIKCAKLCGLNPRCLYCWLWLNLKIRM